MSSRKVPMWLTASVSVAAFGALILWEWRRPLRRETESKIIRNGRNLAVAGLSAIALQLAERPVIEPLTRIVTRRRWGLLKLIRLPVRLEVALAVLLLDYTLYLWHVLTHRVPFLWRFHLVHHVDLDLDASTALRFHFAEMIVSIAWRSLQVVTIGVTPLSFSAWQTFLFPSILFHHSNVRLPVEIERRLNRFIVTPRMHGIHHSTVHAEADSNWSSGLTVWDWLHGTLRLNVPQEKIVIGIPAYRAPEDVALAKILVMPFGEERPAWRLPDGSEQPARDTSAIVAPRETLSA